MQCHELMLQSQLRQALNDTIEEPKLSGKFLGSAVIDFVKKIEIPPVSVVGQGYDGGANMASSTAGAVKFVRSSVNLQTSTTAVIISWHCIEYPQIFFFWYNQEFDNLCKTGNQFY